MQNLVENKLELLKDELNKVKEQYQKKLLEKDMKIEKMERDI